MALEPAKLSDFQIAGSIGAGTTARVYEAVHIATGRPVAIKTLEPSQAGSEMRERFAREALLLAGVDSRFVGKILGFGFDKGQPFLVLERLHGETLDAKLRRDGPPPMPLAVRWIEQLIVGVRDCHAAQVIHRDIKPSNIFVHHDGFEETVKLIDFGVARLKEIAGDTEGLTSTNHLIGSMGYMAPEQFRSAKTVDFTADLYAVGVVVFRTLTGRLPFVSRSLEAVIRMKSEQAPPSIASLTTLPKNVLLDWFIQKAMAREPRDRFQSAREMLEHWWNVMASLDEDATTDVMRGIGRVDESYAGPLHRSSSNKADSIIPISVAPVSESEEFTVKRHAVPIPPQPAPAPSFPVPTPTTPGSEPPPRTERIPVTHPAIHEVEPAPPTAESPDGDGWDMPTRHDPNLRKLVERELELHRKRKGSP